MVLHMLEELLEDLKIKGKKIGLIANFFLKSGVLIIKIKLFLK